MSPNLDRINSEYDVQAAVALDTIALLARRVQNLVASGRRMTLVRRYVDHHATPDVTTGLVLDGEPKPWHQTDGAGFGVNLKPGIHGFGFSAYASDGNATEAEVWHRYHDKEIRRRNITTVEIQGGNGNGHGRNDRLVIQSWNEHGVCEEIVVVFDLGDGR